MRCLRLPARAANWVAPAAGVSGAGGAEGSLGGRSGDAGGAGGGAEDGDTEDACGGIGDGGRARGDAGPAPELAVAGGGVIGPASCAGVGGNAAGVRFEFADWLESDKCSRL